MVHRDDSEDLSPAEIPCKEGEGASRAVGFGVDDGGGAVGGDAGVPQLLSAAGPEGAEQGEGSGSMAGGEGAKGAGEQDGSECAGASSVGGVGLQATAAEGLGAGAGQGEGQSGQAVG